MPYRPQAYGLHPKTCPEFRQRSLEPNDRVAFPGCGSGVVLWTFSEGDGKESDALGLALIWEMQP